MWLRFLLVATVAVTLGACTSFPTKQPSKGQAFSFAPATFSHRVETTQVVLYWNCVRPEPGVFRLDGVAQNPYSSEVRFLEFELLGVDASDHVVSKARGVTPDFVLRTN